MESCIEKPEADRTSPAVNLFNNPCLRDNRGAKSEFSTETGADRNTVFPRYTSGCGFHTMGAAASGKGRGEAKCRYPPDFGEVSGLRTKSYPPQRTQRARRLFTGHLALHRQPRI